jgi:hypothetical protein
MLIDINTFFQKVIFSNKYTLKKMQVSTIIYNLLFIMYWIFIVIKYNFFNARLL